MDTIGKKQNLQNGIQELADGSAQLEDALLFLGESGSKLSESAAALTDAIQKLQMETDGMLDEAFAVDIDNLTAFVKAADNPRILGAAGDMQMNKEVGLLAGIIVMVLFTYVISVFVVHQIQRENSVIGALYAMGAKKRDLILHYITLPTLITGIGGLIGAAHRFQSAGYSYTNDRYLSLFFYSTAGYSISSLSHHLQRCNATYSFGNGELYCHSQTTFSDSPFPYQK